MKAIVIATGGGQGLPLLGERYPGPLLPFMDRPFVQHVVEMIVGQGILHLEFVLCSSPERFEHLLGDGTRWGARFRFHLVKDPDRPYRIIESIALKAEDAPVLLAHADRLPDMRPDQAGAKAASSAVRLLCWRKGDALQWSGWAWLPTEVLKGLPCQGGEDELSEHLRALTPSQGAMVEVPSPLGVRTCEEVLDSARRVLNKEFTGLMLSGREAESGIWLSRNVSLHPTARLVPPVYVGENCQVSEGVQLGPQAVVGSDCVLDARSHISDSLILPGSYIGEALELSKVIVDRNRLINVQLGASAVVTDNFILGSLSDQPMRRWLSAAFSRLVGILLLIPLSPVLLLVALILRVFRSGPVVHKKEVVRLPAKGAEGQWAVYHLRSFRPAVAAGERAPEVGFSDFLLRFLPQLVNVARGELHLVGVPPRAPQEIEALPSDWRSLYLKAKAGIVTEAFVQYGVNPTDDEKYTADAFYSVSAGTGHDARLLLRYFARIIWGAA